MNQKMSRNTQRSLTMYPLEHAIQEGRYRDALLLLEGLLDVVPEHSEAQRQRAQLYALMNRPVEAQDAYSPSHPPFLS